MKDVAALEDRDIDSSKEGELVELGCVSEETKGGAIGGNDNGVGWCFCR